MINNLRTSQYSVTPRVGLNTKESSIAPTEGSMDPSRNTNNGTQLLQNSMDATARNNEGRMNLSVEKPSPTTASEGNLQYAKEGGKKGGGKKGG